MEPDQMERAVVALESIAASLEVIVVVMQRIEGDACLDVRIVNARHDGEAIPVMTMEELSHGP